MSKRSDPKAFARATGARDSATRDPADSPETLLPDPAAEAPPAGALAMQPPPGRSPPMVIEEEEYSPTPHIDANGFDPANYKWVPVRRRARADGWTEARQRAFIEILADTGIVELAAIQVGMSVQSAYQLRRAPGAEPFAAAWAAAIHQASFKLVEIAFQRAIRGSDEPVFDRDGRRVGQRLKPSDRMLMFLLRAHQPERYRHAHLSVRHPAEPLLPPVLPIAEAIATLEPVTPPEPHRLMPPEELDVEVQVADMSNGKLPRWYRQDLEEEDPDFPRDENLERRLEAAREADHLPARRDPEDE